MTKANTLFFEMLQGQQIGPYHLEKLLGLGSFGGVFLANEVVRNQVLRQLAIKVITNTDDASLLELRAATNLVHEYLIRGYSAGEHQFYNVEILYLVMELAEESLENRLQQGKLTIEEVSKILLEVTTALSYLHEQKQIHRDLKPTNILRVKNCWKLSDFGLIRALDNQSYVQTVNASGTIIYMPPEAFDSKISPAWDMWSLGIMLVEILTGEFPYQFNEPTQLYKRVMNGALQLPPLPPEFEPIIVGCLQIDRQKRWTAIETLEYLNKKLFISASDDLYSLSQKLFEKGDQLCKNNKIQEGLVYFNKAINLDPNNTSAWICRGYAFSALSQYTEAIQSFEQALQIQPDLQYVIQAKENALKLEEQKYKDTINHLLGLLEKNQQDTGLIHNIGICFFRLKQYEESVKYFKQCIEINPNLLGSWIFLGTAFNLLNKCEEEVECYYQALNIFPNNIELLFRRGKALLNIKDYKNSILDFNNLVLIDRKNLNAWFFRGIVFYELGDYEEAVQSYEFALSIDPNIADLWYYKGVALFCQDKYEESIIAYQKVLSLDSQSTDLELATIWERLGFSYYCTGAYNDALVAYDKALNLHFNLSCLYEKSKTFTKLKRYEESIIFLNIILEHDPENIFALISKAENYIETKEAKLAIDCCRIVQSIKSGEPYNEEFYIYYLLGNSLAILNQFEYAISFYEAALNCNSEFAECWYRKANLLFDFGQYQKAIESYDQIIKLFPNFYALDMVIDNRERAFFALDGDIGHFVTDWS